MERGRDGGRGEEGREKKGSETDRIEKKETGQ